MHQDDNMTYQPVLTFPPTILIKMRQFISAIREEAMRREHELELTTSAAALTSAVCIHLSHVQVPSPWQPHPLSL